MGFFKSKKNSISDCSKKYNRHGTDSLCQPGAGHVNVRVSYFPRDSGNSAIGTFPLKQKVHIILLTGSLKNFYILSII